MLEHVTDLVVIPENYYGVAPANEEIYFSPMISCMGICLFDLSGSKSFVHLADLYGFPFRSLAKNAHPIPRNYWNNLELFDLLKTNLRTKLTKAVIFGNYKAYSTLFNMHPSVFNHKKIANYTANKLNLNVDQVMSIYFKDPSGTNIKLSDNNIELLTNEELKLYDIESENLDFYWKSQHK